MRVVFYASTKERERTLSEAFARGVRVHADQCEVLPDTEYSGPKKGVDVAVVFGLSQASRRIVDDYTAAGKHYVYGDKGYIRHTDSSYRMQIPHYYRMSVDSFQPLPYFEKWPREPDRWKESFARLRGWRKAQDGPILLAGCSSKYCWWKRFPGADLEKGDALNEVPSLWAEQVVAEIRKYTDREVWYRPKPSFKHARPVEGAKYVQARHLEELLKTAWCLVTFGSNSATEAMLAGVPVFTLGDAIARPMGLSDLSKIEEPYYPEDKERYQWAFNMSYCQFQERECMSGIAWQALKEVIERKERGEW